MRKVYNTQLVWAIYEDQLRDAKRARRVNTLSMYSLLSGLCSLNGNVPHKYNW